MTRTAAYLRVSTEEQANEGLSLQAQEARLRAYTAMRDLDLVELITDPGVSAGRPLDRRDGGRRLLQLVRRRQVEVVVAYKLDRLFRDCADCLPVTRIWDNAGIALHLIDLGGQAIDTTSAMGRFFLTVMAAAAELELNQIRERTAAAMAHKRACGEYTGGEPPYGWRVAEDGVMLRPHLNEQRAITTGRTLRASGLSLRKVGAELEDLGILPRSGRAWHAKTVRGLLASEAA